MNVFNEMHDWSKKPFSSDMSVKGWLAFIGLLLVAVIMWQQIIKFIIG